MVATMTATRTAILTCLALWCGFACSASDHKLGPNELAGGDAGDAGSSPLRGGMGGAGGYPDLGGDAGALAQGLAGSDESSAEPGAGAAGSAGSAGCAGSAGAGGSSSGEPLGAAAGAAGSSSGGFAGQVNDSLGVHCAGCSATELGSPVWNLAGPAMAVGMIGTLDTGSQPFLDFIGSVVQPTHRYFQVEGLFGPGVPHAGPYSDEGYALFSGAGVSVKQAFSTSEFAGPTGALLTVNLVPSASAPLGSSTDFTTGPIIPNALFPLQIDGDLYREGVLYDPEFDSNYPGYGAFQPPIEKDGSSHVMLWFGENSSYVPDVAPQGSYLFKLSIVDASGAGWLLDVPFTVQDNP